MNKKDMQIQEKYQEAVEEFVRRVKGKYEDKIDSIILFGSVARGEAKEDSDVDILVVVKERNIEDMKEIHGIAFEVSMEEPKTHEGALSMFGLHVIRESDVEEYYGKALRFAKEEREKSDYDVLAKIIEEEAKSIVEDAEKFLVRIKDAINGIQKKLDEK